MIFCLSMVDVVSPFPGEKCSKRGQVTADCGLLLEESQIATSAVGPALRHREHILRDVLAPELLPRAYSCGRMIVGQ